MSEIRNTNRLAALVVLAIFVCALGVLAGNRIVLVAAVAPLAYVAYGQLTTVPELDVVVERAVDEATPAPGAEVEVTVTVTNAGDHTVPELRIVDGVPAALGVASGAPRRATALRPGESTTLTYGVVAKRGVHEFGETYLEGRSFSGSEARERGVAAAGVAELACHAAVSDPVDREVTHRYAGQVATDEAGTGLEFHATREHQHGDPVNRIDWNRYAREGELTTVEYRERRGAPVVVVVDLRPDVDVARRAIDPPASELGIYAAHRLLEPLVEYGNEVGLAFHTGTRTEWLAPGRGSNHEARVALAVREASERAWSGNTTTLDGGRESETPSDATRSARATRADGRGPFRDALERLEERLPAAGNVVLVSPFLDSFPRAAATYFGSFGHGVTVLSPDVVPRDAVGGRVAGLDRELAITRLRRAGTDVVTWDPDDPLAEAIARTLEGQL